jgi:hypothetical protein
MREVSSPWVLAGLMLVVSVVGAVGEHVLLAGNSGFVVTGLVNAIPQVICLVVIGRLMAALITGSPDGSFPSPDGTPATPDGTFPKPDGTSRKPGGQK